MSALRIIHVFRAPLGGLFRHVVDVTREQIARGHSVGILCDSTTGGARADELLGELEPGLKLGLRRIPIARNPGLSDLRALSAIRAFAREAGADVVHGHGSKGGAYARLPAFIEGPERPIRAYTPHGGSFNYYPGSFLHGCYMAAEKFQEKRTDLFLFESDFIGQKVREAVGDTRQLVRVVHNGVSEDEFEPIQRAPDAFDILYLGELRFAKGIDTLLMALALLKQEQRCPTLLIVGSGPEEAALKARVTQLDLDSQVTFAPPAPIRSVLARGRIMAVPSRAESLPYVILEAAAAAQPLVSTNVGGIPEIFGPHADRLIPPDDPVAFANALKAALDQPDNVLKQQASDLSAFVHSGFSLQGMVDGVMEAYRDALALRAKRLAQAGH